MLKSWSAPVVASNTPSPRTLTCFSPISRVLLVPSVRSRSFRPDPHSPQENSNAPLFCSAFEVPLPRHDAAGVVVVGHGQAELLQVVTALGPRGRLANFLNGGQQQTDQHGDNRDDDEQLDECKAAAPAARDEGRDEHGNLRKAGL